MFINNTVSEFLRGVRDYHRLTFTQKCRLLVPALFAAFLFASLLNWHISWIYIAPDISLYGIAGLLGFPIAVYSVVALSISALAWVLFLRAARKGSGGGAGLAALTALYVLDSILRTTDWSCVYFGGQRVNMEFWYHAFYIDGMSFLLTPETLALLAIIAGEGALFYAILRLYRSASAMMSGGKGSVRHAIIAINALLYAAAVGGCTIALLATGPDRQANAREALVARIPEQAVIGSFFEYAFSREETAAAPPGRETRAKLEKSGIRLYSMDERYPLMKKSIYLDHRSASAAPRLAWNTNVIIVFAESMSGFFLREESGELKRLTPHYRDMMRQGYSFSRMFSANYPTVRGMIATLGSSLYSIEKVRGMHKGTRMRIPLLCRFLLLSDALKNHGYTATHVQGGSGTFVGMRDAFTRRQGYDRFYDRESIELLAYARHPHNRSHWGVRDQDVFGFAVKLLKEGIRQPFLLTISTLDMHPPFDPLFTHEAAGGSGLLNCLYSSDLAFGEFWEYFRNSPYRGNTLVLVVADHAMGPNAEYVELLDRLHRPGRGTCDFIPCIMYWPDSREWRGATNPVLCTNLDIAPTLLDMLGMDLPNPFLGLSLFSERPAHPPLVSDFYLPGEKIIMDSVSAEEKAEILDARWTEADQSAFEGFLKGLALRRAIVPEEE